MNSISLRNGLVRLAVSVAAGMAAMSAQAGVLGGPITVNLTSPGGTTTNGGASVNPTPVNLTDTVSVADGIHANDGAGGFLDTNIGGFMLSGEFITFGGANADISLRVGAGSQDDKGTLSALDDTLSTGYLSAGANRARYVLSGLSITGEVITGFDITGSGFDAPVDLKTLISFDKNSPGTISIFLDTMLFTPDARGALFAGGNLVIDLLTCKVGDLNCGTKPPNPTPEPASLALLLAALAGLPVWRRQFPPAKRRSA